MVLVALAAIILPDVLDGEKIKRKQEFAAIPLQPALEPREFEALEEPQRLPVIASGSDSIDLQPLESTEPSATVSANDTEVTQVGDINPTDKKLEPFSDSAHVIQLGVFRNAKNVNALVEKLRDAGYPAFSKPKKPIQGEPTWVYVGPDLDTEKLKSMRPELKALTGLNGKVFPYNPKSQ
nr:SPOR domain-containing protein [Echinimonas agarilytica]